MPREQAHFEGEMCEACGINPKRKKGYHRGGQQRYGSTCSSCHNETYRNPWLSKRKDSCEMCGFKPMFRRTLTVHHRDGNKKNNEEHNLMTLCANCHSQLEGVIVDCEGNWTAAEKLFKKFLKAMS